MQKTATLPQVFTSAEMARYIERSSFTGVFFPLIGMMSPDEAYLFLCHDELYNAWTMRQDVHSPDCLHVVLAEDDEGDGMYEKAPDPDYTDAFGICIPPSDLN